MTLKQKVRYGSLAALALLLIFFIGSNRTSHPINIIVGEVSMPMAFVIILSFLGGAGMMWLWLMLKPKFSGKKPE